jgi:transposase-like protein
MEQQAASPSCPACGSTDYVFRGRKKVPAVDSQPVAIETKYRCRACGKEWKVRAAA